MKKTLQIFLILCLTHGLAKSSSWYVSTTGSDDNEGSEGSPFATIQHGIDASSDGDTVLVSLGTYVENINYNGKNIVVTGEDRETTIIDGNQNGSVVTFDSFEDSSSVLKKFTIQNGFASNGGGIYCVQTTGDNNNNSGPTLEDLNIIVNVASQNGGGIYLSLSSPKIISSNIQENTAQNGGGIACFFDSNPTIIDGNISNNSSVIDGGGIYATTNSDVQINNSIFTGNTASYGGALLSSSSWLIIYESLFANNSGNNGTVSAWNGSNLVLGNVTIANNGSNGNEIDDYGIYNNESNITVISSIVWNNENSHYGNVNFQYSNIDEDPLFCNPNVGDFSLYDNSPCLGTGQDGGNMGAFGIGCSQPYVGPVWHVSTTIGLDDNDGSEESPFATIQHAMDVASEEDTVLVYPGNYTECVTYNGKNIKLLSLAITEDENSYINQTIIYACDDPPEDYSTWAVRFRDIETESDGVDSSAKLAGFTISNGFYGVWSSNDDHPTIEKLIIKDNDKGLTINNLSYVKDLVIKNNNEGLVLDYVYNDTIIFQNLIIHNNNRAIESNESNAIFNRCIFYSNSQWRRFNRGNHKFLNCTFYDNTGSFEWWNQGSLEIQNSILWNNNLNLINLVNPENELNVSYTIIGDNPGISGVGLLDSDPLFFDQNISNFNLTENSPAIDAGNPDLDGDGEDYNTDIDDQDIDGTRMDIGALYLLSGPVWYVSNGGSDDWGNGSVDLPFLTIQKGINVSNDGDTVFVSAGVYYENVIIEAKNIILIGDNRESTILNGGENTNVVRIFSVEEEKAVLKNFTIMNGFGQDGGGVEVLNSNLEIIDCNIQQNIGSHAGGIFTNASDVIITGCQINNNQSVYNGGGIIVGGHGGSVSINFSTVANNVAVYTGDWQAGVYGGGGLFASDQNEINIINSIFRANYPESIYQYGTNGDLIATYSNIQGGWEGIGNIDANPLFINQNVGNYRLTENSPCIDAGDPNSPLDPDNTIADMGAYFFSQIAWLNILGLSSTNVGTNDSVNFSWVHDSTNTLDTAYIDILYSDQSIRADTVLASNGYASVEVPDSSLEAFQLTLTLLDSLGNEIADTTELITVFDNTSPEVVVLTPSGEFNIPEYEYFTVSWNHSDNISISEHFFEYSSDGISYDSLLLTPNMSQAYSHDFELQGVTNNGRIRLTVSDDAGNTATSFSGHFTVTDNTPPEVSLLSPVDGSSVGIADLLMITWESTDNVNVDYVDLFYRLGNGDYEPISLNEVNDGIFNWFVPNEPSDNLQISVIAFDGVGLSDTSSVENIEVLITYPKILSTSPDGEIIGWGTREFNFSVSQRLDASTINSVNVQVTSLHSNQLIPTIRYIDSSSVINISYETSMASLDSVTISLSDQITNIYGYSLDGDNDGIPGGSYSTSFNTAMLADYNNDFQINVDDLAQFMIGLENEDMAYEIGPFSGEIPHVFTSLDQKFDIEDVMAFVIMWNWYVTNNSVQLAALENLGEMIVINTSHDSIYFQLPAGVLAYQVQIKHKPNNIMFGGLKSDGSVNSSKTNIEEGVYNLINIPKENTQFALPIDIKGKKAEITFTIRALGTDQAVLSQQTSKLTIENIPEQYALYDNYPNPFNAVTRIEYDLPEDTRVQLFIYDILGKQINTLVNTSQKAGYKSVRWDGTNGQGRNVSAGMYFYHLQTKGYSKVRKMILLK